MYRSEAKGVKPMAKSCKTLFNRGILKRGTHAHVDTNLYTQCDKVDESRVAGTAYRIEFITRRKGATPIFWDFYDKKKRDQVFLKITGKNRAIQKGIV